MHEHSKTLNHLDISNCSFLTEKALHCINSIFTSVTDPARLVKTVRVLEENINYNGSGGGGGLPNVILHKQYANGVITTFSRHGAAAQTERVGTVVDDYELNQRMGAFDDPDFLDFLNQKLSEMNEANDDMDSTSSFEEPLTVADDCDPLPTEFRLTFHTSPTIELDFALPQSYDATSKNRRNVNRYQSSFKPLETYVCKKSECLKTLEITNWQRCQLQTLIIGRSTQILPEYMDEDGYDDVRVSGDRAFLKSLDIMPLFEKICRLYYFEDL